MQMIEWAANAFPISHLRLSAFICGCPQMLAKFRLRPVENKKKTSKLPAKIKCFLQEGWTAFVLANVQNNRVQMNGCSGTPGFAFTFAI
jgi:hypothetical protein